MAAAQDSDRRLQAAKHPPARKVRVWGLGSGFGVLGSGFRI